MKCKNIREANLITKFFKDLGWYVYEYEDCVEFETWTKAGVNILISLQDVTFYELSNYLISIDWDEEIDLLRESKLYRKQFTLKQSVDDIYGFYSMFNAEWDRFLEFYR